MDRHEIKTLINEYLRKNGADYVAVFGSFARQDDHLGSDIDILVSFAKPVGLLSLVQMEYELESKTGRKIDLVTTGAIKSKRLRESIEKDLQVL